MADSAGSGFPTTNLEKGHLFYDIDDNILYMYIGGDPKLRSSWKLISGSFNGDPDTSSWGDVQSGDVWFNKSLDELRVWSGTRALSVYPFNYRRVTILQEDFWVNSSSPYVTRNGGTQGAGTLVNGRVGISKVGTGAAANTVVGLFMGAGNEVISAGGFGLVYETTWVLKLNSVTPDMLIRIGNIVSGGTVNPASNGRYFEKTGSDTTFFMVTRGGSVETRVDTGIPIDTGYHTFKIIQDQSVSPEVSKFIFDGNELLSTTTNQLQINIRPALSLVNLAAVDVSIDLDYFEFVCSVLGR
jgi:hypothetical protein